MSNQTVLILGGGIGGVVAANKLRKRLNRRHRVVVVEREKQFSLAASYLWVMTGDRKPAQISRPLERLERKGIEVLRGNVQQIDPGKHEVVVDGNRLHADHIIVALGAEFTPRSIPGLADSGYTFCLLDDVVRLRDRLQTFRSGKVVLLTAAPAYKCPAAPYEAAMLLAGMFRKRGVRDEIEIELHSAEPGPMGVAGQEASHAVRSMVESKGISYVPSHQVSRVEDSQVIFSDESNRPFDLLVYVPPIAPPEAVRESGLTDESGWVRVDRHTMETQFTSVYALGDVTMIPLKMGKPLPKAGVFAHAQAEAVAHRIADEIEGVSSSAAFSGSGGCFVETGKGKAGFGSGDFYAEPAPAVTMRKPSWIWHAGKALFEKQVMFQWL